MKEKLKETHDFNEIHELPYLDACIHGKNRNLRVQKFIILSLRRNTALLSGCLFLSQAVHRTH